MEDALTHAPEEAFLLRVATVNGGLIERNARNSEMMGDGTERRMSGSLWRWGGPVSL